MKRLFTVALLCCKRQTAYCYCLLLCFLLGTGAFAQSSSVNIRYITANYAASPPTVTFEVSWAAGSRNANERSKIWLLVDYRRIQSNAYMGDWLRAGVAALPATNAGTVSLEPNNTKGFWLQGPNDNLYFAATVTVPVTVDVSGYDRKFGWCGYASDRPPYAEEKSTYYALNGTTPFIIQTHPTNSSSTISRDTKAYDNCIYGLTDATGCPVEVIPPMPAISSFTATATEICAGQSVTLTANATNAQRYSFDNGTTWGNSASTVVTPSITTTYILKATHTNGACTVTYPTQLTVTVHPVPELEFVSPPIGLCANSTATLTVNDKNSVASSYCFTYECTDCTHNDYLTGNDEAAAVGCYWYSECVYGEANTYTVYSYDAGTLTVWAKVTTPYGCVDSTRVDIAINTASVAAAVITGDDANICPESTVLLTAAAAGATTFTWYKDGQEVLTGTSNTYSVTESGSYTVQGKNANCTGTTSASKVVTISVCNDVQGCEHLNLKLYQASLPYDGTGNWDDANEYCTDNTRKARLPTQTELQCMCSNKGNLPGGYVGGDYWSATQYSSTNHYIVYFSSSGCATNDYNDDDNSVYFRCVL